MTMVHLPELEMAEVVDEVDLSTLTLDELAERANAEHAACGEAIERGLAHALRAGATLNAARLHVRNGQWLQWIRDNTDMSPYDAVRKLQPIIDGAVAEGLSVEARAIAVRLEDEIFKALKR